MSDRRHGPKRRWTLTAPDSVHGNGAASAAQPVQKRYGCPGCGTVMTEDDIAYDVPCGGVGGVVALPTAADVLAFKLRAAGRHDEALGVEDRRAVLGEHA